MTGSSSSSSRSASASVSARRRKSVSLAIGCEAIALVLLDLPLAGGDRVMGVDPDMTSTGAIRSGRFTSTRDGRRMSQMRNKVVVR